MSHHEDLKVLASRGRSGIVTEFLGLIDAQQEAVAPAHSGRRPVDGHPDLPVGQWSRSVHHALRSWAAWSGL